EPMPDSDPFEEVAVDFTEEEWALLDSNQKALCKEVMLEVAMNMAALGKDPLCSGFQSLEKVFSFGGKWRRYLH
uniref:KRAB domain-containing protein n=1 Tax=Laticauda laticaudata TaxID=8630 RepID=A0A8C5RPP7_LATLA